MSGSSPIKRARPALGLGAALIGQEEEQLVRDVLRRKELFRYYCRNRNAHAPGASPFARFEQRPAPGYRAQDFPKTESLVHRFVAVPLGVPYTDEDADYIGRAVGHVHAELGR